MVLYNFKYLGKDPDPGSGSGGKLPDPDPAKKVRIRIRNPASHLSICSDMSYVDM